jgi:putative transposase
MASTLTNLLYHIIFSTKSRKRLINDSYEERLYAYIGGIVKGNNGTLLAIGGMQDHIHLLIKHKASVSLSDLVKTIKSISSKWVNETIQQDMPFACQVGYGAFTVSESQIAKVESYIRYQKRHHINNSFEEEYKKMIENNKIIYDIKYILD